jgi:cysteine desulfurase
LKVVILNQTRIYFDHAATTPLSQTARAAMEPYFSQTFGNASSPYAVSRASRMALENARAQIAALIGAHADEIAFTSGGTESDNWALLGVALSQLKNIATKNHVLISSVEHHAVLEAGSTLRELGFEVEEIPSDENGAILPEAVRKLLRPETFLVSVMAVNNEVGSVQPIAEIGASCRAAGVLLHTDAVQAAGKIEIDVENWSCDLLTLSAHKIGGPKGAGALFIRRNTQMKSLLRGGGQERGRRAGTENVPAIVGFGAAAKNARENLEVNSNALHELQSELESGLKEISGAQINGAGFSRAPHITNVSFENQRAESLALNLDLQGFAVGTGSACASGAIEPSHVLRAMGLDKETSRASLRISLGAQNTREEVQEFLEVLKNLIGHKDHKGSTKYTKNSLCTL